MIAVSTTRPNITMLRRHNTWYTVIDGNWSNPNIWISNGKRKNSLPQPGDDVYVDNNINIDTAVTINNMYVAGTLTAANGITLTINGDLQATGPLNFTGSNATITLNGFNNNVNAFSAGNTTVIYNRPGDQNVLPVSYKNLAIYNIGVKYLSADTTILGNLNINDFQIYDALLECGTYNLTVVGNTSITAKGNNGNGNFNKNGSGNIVFKGTLTINANTNFSSAITSIECQGGFTGNGFGGNITVNCPFKFTTSSQTFNTGSIYFYSSVLISGSITITYINSAGVYFMSGVTGDNSNSVLTNNGLINIGSSNPIMSVGIFNYMSGSSSSIGYIMNSDFTLPYATYNNLTILGTGLKTLSNNTTVNNLNINNFTSSKSRLDCGAYNLTINGNFNVSGTGTGDTLDAGLIKSASGNITFIGPAVFNTANISYSSNTLLEFRAGVTFNPFGTHSGTIDATVNFTTASQSLQGSGMIFNGNINISGGIIVTINSGGHTYNSQINGSTASDKLTNTGTIIYQNINPPMQVGVLDCSSTANTFIYAQNNQSIAPGTYRNLTLQGSGVKMLLGNVSVINTYSLFSPATVNLNGFVLTNP